VNMCVCMCVYVFKVDVRMLFSCQFITSNLY